MRSLRAPTLRFKSFYERWREMASFVKVEMDALKVEEALVLLEGDGVAGLAEVLNVQCSFVEFVEDTHNRQVSARRIRG